MISGSLVFSLHDTHGIPFDYILEEFREKRLKFNVKEWVITALRSGWTKKKIISFLCHRIDMDKRTENAILWTYLIALQEVSNERDSINLDSYHL